MECWNRLGCQCKVSQNFKVNVAAGCLVRHKFLLCKTLSTRNLARYYIPKFPLVFSSKLVCYKIELRAKFQAKLVTDPFAKKFYFPIQNNFGVNFGLKISGKISSRVNST